MLPQRRISPGMPLKVPPKTAPGVSPRIPLRTSSRALLSPKGGLGIHPKPKKAPPPKAPTSLFGEKKHWSKLELREKIRKLSPFILRGRIIPRQEREQMVERWFPHKRFGTHVQEGEVKRRLRELRGLEHRAKAGKEKKIYETQRKLLGAFTGIKKY